MGHTHDALWRIKTIRSLSAAIKQVDCVDCISVDDSGAGQRIKNINAKRYVPIHNALLEQGFMAFVTQRNTTHTQLFDYKPVGIIEDWSKIYCKQLARLQNEIGMQANKRPTTYGLRHANPNITYSRYGKDAISQKQPVFHPKWLWEIGSF